jgi:very-short-patch-repair endonuclease
MPKSEVEERLAFQLRACKIAVVREFKFHPTRKWRFDFSIPELKIAFEVEGAIWSGGRHARPKGIIGDIEKYNAALDLGWRVYRFPSEQIKSGKAIDKILKILEKRNDNS